MGKEFQKQRRAFLAATGGALASLPFLSDSLAARTVAEFLEKPKAQPEVHPDYWKQLPGGQTQCFVCPLLCILNEGETCFCRTRTNKKGRLKTMAYENPCVLAVDPIEKVPLHHYRPGTNTLALGTAGCNLRCLYCQNWEQSQKKPPELRKSYNLPVDRAVASLKGRDIDTLAFTYTEPIAFFEYLCDLAKEAKKKKVKTVAATALYATNKAAKQLGKTLDAACVGLKGFDDDFYLKVCGVERQPVFDAILTMASENVHLEVTTLIVPGYNDKPDELKKLGDWIRTELGPDTPWHVARFVPKYRLSKVPQTPIPVLERTRKEALDAGMKHVYLSNVAPHDGNQTWCAKCGHKTIERLGLRLVANHLDKTGHCPKCRKRVRGKWR